MKATKANEKLFWDSRASNYPRPFEAGTSARTRRILRLAARLGVDFRGRRVLDIGCGTGSYALLLAARSPGVLGVDSSPAMLKVYRAERRRRGIKNAPCLRCEWGKVPVERVKGRFDIALASMTAAVRSRGDILKMEAAAGEACVYVGWAGVRRNALLKRVYAAHGAVYKPPEGASRTLRLLAGLGRAPRTVYLRETWTKEATVAGTMREIAVSMRVNGVKFRKDWTEAFLKPLAMGGIVRQRTMARKAVIVWAPPVRKGPI